MTNWIMLMYMKSMPGYTEIKSILLFIVYLVNELNIACKVWLGKIK